MTTTEITQADCPPDLKLSWDYGTTVRFIFHDEDGDNAEISVDRESGRVYVRSRDNDNGDNQGVYIPIEVWLFLTSLL